jgi:hypothetical protein
MLTPGPEPPGPGGGSQAPRAPPPPPARALPTGAPRGGRCPPGTQGAVSQRSGLQGRGLEIKVQGSGFRVQGLGFRAWGKGSGV